MIQLKSPEQIEGIRESSRILVETFQFIKKFVQEGIKAIEIDREVEKFIGSKKAVPSFKGFRGFPGSACVSINQEIVHGIPSDRKLEKGQIVGVDIGVKYRGYYSDAAYTFTISEVDSQIERLVKTTRDSLYKGIAAAHGGNRLSDISHAIQTYAEANEFSVVRDLVGHGVGLDVWELPQVPNYGAPGKGPKLRPGMVLAIEPMLNIGTCEIETEEDGWTVVTKDRQPSAHFEHTIAITEHAAEVLTEGI